MVNLPGFRGNPYPRAPGEDDLGTRELLQKALRMDRIHLHRRAEQPGASVDDRWEDRVETLHLAREARATWRSALEGLPGLFAEEIKGHEALGDRVQAQRLFEDCVRVFEEIASEAGTPVDAAVACSFALVLEDEFPRRVAELDRESRGRIDAALQHAQEDRKRGVSIHRAADERMGLLTDWYMFQHGVPIQGEAALALRELDYVVVERLAVAISILLIALLTFVLLVLRVIGPSGRTGIPVRLVLRARDFLKLFAMGTVLPLALYLAVTQLPIGLRDYAASITFRTWVFQFAGVGMLIVGLNWLAAGAIVRRRFAHLGMQQQAPRRSWGGLLLLSAATAVFFLAPVAAWEDPGERTWSTISAAVVVLSLAGVLLSLALGLLRCVLDPRRRAPGQSAVAGVAVVGFALAIVVLGSVASPWLRARESHLLTSIDALVIDSRTGMTAEEQLRLNEFRSLFVK